VKEAPAGSFEDRRRREVRSLREAAVDGSMSIKHEQELWEQYEPDDEAVMALSYGQGGHGDGRSSGRGIFFGGIITHILPSSIGKK
jgi:hypothetical protein